MHLLKAVTIGLLGATALSAECFESGKAAYKTPGGKWRKAVIRLCT